jgi:hypothetical protein
MKLTRFVVDESPRRGVVIRRAWDRVARSGWRAILLRPRPYKRTLYFQGEAWDRGLASLDTPQRWT